MSTAASWMAWVGAAALATANLGAADGEGRLRQGSLSLGLTSTGAMTLGGAGTGQAHAFMLADAEPWALRFVDGTRLTAAEFLAPPWSGSIRLTAEPGRVVQHWEAAGLALDILAAAGEAGLDLRLRIERCQRGLDRIDFPAAFRFDPQAVSQVVFPERTSEGVGLALAGSFFAPHH